jgi:transposase-like protein
VDGVYTPLRESDDPRLCLLVIIGVRADGTKEWVAIEDGLRESTESWLDVLRDLKARGLKKDPLLALGDGALGFWAALEQVYPETVHQRCRHRSTARPRRTCMRSGWPRRTRTRYAPSMLL